MATSTLCTCWIYDPEDGTFFAETCRKWHSIFLWFVLQLVHFVG